MKITHNKGSEEMSKFRKKFDKMTDKRFGYQATIKFFVLIIGLALTVQMLIQDYIELGELAGMGMSPPIEYVLFQFGLVCLEFIVVCAIAGALCGTVLSIWDSLKKRKQTQREML